ncbi:MAG: 16S rRNA (cytosine(1402)-N(4))-methyltransferase RsmH [Treponema sp.]|nr:16S rRNA (cytosine(1402)-N(4))-methyltransferase RsmH [Treponema sp.]
MEIVHTPVLLEETIQFLAPRKKEECMIDATMGEGGHSFAFLSRFPDLRVIGIDADRDIQDIARQRLTTFGNRVVFYTGWSQDFFALLPRPDTILIDLGISLYHYQKGNRGFSFARDEPLDMRIDKNTGTAASDLLDRLSEKELANLLYANGEKRYSRRIARSIKDVRGRITSSKALAEIVTQSVPAAYRYGSIHPATKTFQALRIAVNREIERLPALLEAALNALKPGGRMGVISFHSLEDRIVKIFFREKGKNTPNAPINRKSKQGMVTLLSRKSISPCPEEIRNNPPSRSARLRIAEKNAHENRDDICGDIGKEGQ